MKRLGYLDVLRGLAIVGVVFHHLFYSQFRYGMTGIEFPAVITLIASSGWMGVNLFFFLSGFVLYLPYATGSRTMQSWGDAKRFYKHRALRILPLYYLSAAIALLVSGLVPGSRDFWVALGHYVFVTFPYSKAHFMPPGNWVLWSIGVEIWFSIMFPALLILIARMGVWRYLALTLAIAFAVRYISQLGGTIDHSISDSVFGRLDEFAYGMLGAHIYASRKRISWPVGMIGLGLIFFAIWLWSLSFLSKLGRINTAILNMPLDLGILLLTLALLSLPPPRRIFLPVQAMGMMCYSLYIWHGMILVAFQQSLAKSYAYLPLYLLTVLAVSAFTYRYVEFRGAPWRRIFPFGVPGKIAQ